MTRFEASVIMFMVMAIMLILLFGVISVISILNDIKQQHEDIKDNILDDSVGLPAISKKLDDLRIVVPELQWVLNDLVINVKGNYNTLEQQQRDIGYIGMRINHILSLMHPAEEVIKPDAPTALDGLSNVQKDNANKSTNYNGYDPTFIVKGSETTDKED